MTQKKIWSPLPEAGRDCHRMLIKVDPGDIAYLVEVFESHESLGIPRTIDQAEGIVEILASPDYVEEARALLEALKEEMRVDVIRM
ncbi:MAG: DUF4911 domain-containing protein [Nitrospinae bacterium]|nr:DUF4911 domain-containing protein [Nitrospinota bacterium]